MTTTFRPEQVARAFALNGIIERLECGVARRRSVVIRWTSGIIAKSVTRESFEAWGTQVAGRRVGAEKRTMNEIAASVGLPPRTFFRYVTGAAEQIARALDSARVPDR